VNHLPLLYIKHGSKDILKYISVLNSKFLVLRRTRRYSVHNSAEVYYLSVHDSPPPTPHYTPLRNQNSNKKTYLTGATIYN